MDETRSRYWLYIILYTLLCIVFLGVLFFVAMAFAPKTSPALVPGDDRISSRFIAGPNSYEEAYSNPSEEKIMLVINRDINIGKSKIVYRGLDGDAKFSIDLAIIDLDPQAFYRYRIPISDAEKGFRLAGQKFKLISARKSTIQLWHLKN